MKPAPPVTRKFTDGRYQTSAPAVEAERRRARTALFACSTLTQILRTWLSAFHSTRENFHHPPIRRDVLHRNAQCVTAELRTHRRGIAQKKILRATTFHHGGGIWSGWRQVTQDEVRDAGN